jgi:hypothetical protein
MNDDIKNASAGAPPKLILRRPAVGIPTDPPSSDSATVQESRPPTTKKQTTRIDLSTVEASSTGTKSKKQTSRISLEAATLVQPEAGTPRPGILESAPSDETALRTIKIKRPASAQAPKHSQPIDLLINRPSASLSDSERSSLKKQTSRISLEAALTPEEAPSAPIAEGVPTSSPSPTIRIKRPGKTAPEMPSVGGSTPPLVPLTEQPTLTKSQTAKIEIAPSAIPPAESEGQPTQRKTIKIRRPDGQTAPTIQRSGGGRSPVRIVKDAAAGLEGGIGDLNLRPPSMESEVKTPLTPRQKILRLVGNIVFSAVASFAVIVSGIVVYILTLQKYDW